jgi:DNA-binding transcriptional MerR regulator
MNKLDDHEGFWGPAEELIERAKRLQKAFGVNLKTISVRLVRYYASEGVIDKPDRLGREAAYHYKHLLQLLLARRLSEHGVMLADIRTLVSGQSVLELEGKLRCSTQPLLDEIKHRRVKETVDKAIDLAISEVAKGTQPHYINPELDAMTYQLKYVGDSIKTVAREVDTLGKTNLELATQNEKLLNTVDEVHYLLRESTEYQKYMRISFEHLTQRIDYIEAIAREQETECRHERITNTFEQLLERMALLENSVYDLVTEIRSANN